MKTARLLIAGVLAVPGVTLSLDQQAPRGGYREEARVERVIVDAYVLDSRGNPIPDLTPQSFRLRVDGRPVAVESVDWIPAEKPEAVPVEGSLQPDSDASAPASVEIPPGAAAALLLSDRLHAAAALRPGAHGPPGAPFPRNAAAHRPRRGLVVRLAPEAAPGLHRRPREDPLGNRCRHPHGPARRDGSRGLPVARPLVRFPRGQEGGHARKGVRHHLARGPADRRRQVADLLRLGPADDRRRFRRESARHPRLARSASRPGLRAHQYFHARRHRRRLPLSGGHAAQHFAT